MTTNRFARLLLTAGLLVVLALALASAAFADSSAQQDTETAAVAVSAETNVAAEPSDAGLVDPRLSRPPQNVTGATPQSGGLDDCRTALENGFCPAWME